MARLVVQMLALAALGATAAHAAGDRRRFATYANPVDLPYRYQPGAVPYREAADPTVVRFKGRYWMFASHSKGYWHSTDLLHWAFVEPTGVDMEKYAPAAVAMGGRLYLTASENAPKMWVTDDPLSGQWREAADIAPGYNDPALFRDDDGRLYLYEGLSSTDVLRVFELDPNTFRQIGSASVPASRDKARRGWEIVGDANEREDKPTNIEGSWMTKHGGRYYLQYAAPGTEFRTYGDGVLVSRRPMGPFTFEGYSPFSFKPTGFISGAGHGSSFEGAGGQWWHAATMTISVRHIFERRLGLFPTRFTDRGELVTDTYLGDYPHYVGGDRGLTGWMLLSRRKPVKASSVLPGFVAANAVDEDVRTWWSAKSGNTGEWFEVDLGAAKRIEAVQVNFADQASRGAGISRDGYRYVLEASPDGKRWATIVDRSRDARDSPHDYQILTRAMQARFVRIRNRHMPDDGNFSLSDLRVFGSGDGAVPATVRWSEAKRDSTDSRRATVRWTAARGAEFYIVRLGTRPDLLIQNYQVYDGRTSLRVPSLNSAARYWFAVDGVNENGITRGVARPVVNAPSAVRAPRDRAAGSGGRSVRPVRSRQP